MIYRDFKGIKLSALGFGTMRLPVNNGNDTDICEKEAEKMYAYAYEHGVNYFDTAWGYHSGKSELMAGKFLSSYPRNTYYLATKFPGYDNSNMLKVREIFEEQLKKCQTEYFDFYLFHNVYEGNIDDYLDPRFHVMETLMEFKAAGKIKHLGFSTHGSIEVIKRFLNAYGKNMEFCQLQVNYMDWHFQNAEEKVKLVSEWGIPIWVMEPLRGGKLAKADEEMASTLREIRPNTSIPSFAFRFLQSIPGVTVVLSGMSDMEQMKENIKIWNTDEPLSKSEFDRLVAMTDKHTKKGEVPCTACHYCTSHCPQSLPIPDLISLYNEHKITGGGFIAPMAIAAMSEDKRPHNCIGCRSCEAVCPQQIKISEIMSEFAEMMK